MRLRDYITHERVLSSQENQGSSSGWTKRFVTIDAWRSPPSTLLMYESLPRCGRCRLTGLPRSTRMESRRCLVYFRFPGACSSSSVRIVRKESVASCRSMELPLTAFSKYVDVLTSNYIERPVARIRIPTLFWIYYLLRQTDLSLYVIERQPGIEG